MGWEDNWNPLNKGGIVNPQNFVAGVSGAYGDLSGADAKAAADQAAATAMQKAAADALQFQKDTQTKAAGIAAPSADQLLAIANQYGNAASYMATQVQTLQSNLNLINSGNPALVQAGIQAYQLMTGREAASLAPIKNQRALQRTQLENSLRDRMGSGFNTSSAGMEALNQFDTQTENLMTSAQQNAIGQYMGFAQSANVIGNQNISSGASTYGNLVSQAMAGEQNIKAGQVSAITSTMPNFQNTINTAGAPYVGARDNANTQGQLFGLAVSAGANYLSGGMAGMAAPATPSSTSGAGNYNWSSDMYNPSARNTAGGYNLGGAPMQY